MTTVTVVAALVVSSIAAMSGAATAQTRPGGPAPLVGAGSEGVIPGRYIVVLRTGPDGSDPATMDRAALAAAPAAGALTRARKNSVRIGQEYRHALSGFSAELSAKQLAQIREDPDVAYVAPSVRGRLDGVQSNAPWGLDRMDQASLPLNNTYNFVSDGTGVTAFVIDSGIRATHAEFEGRVRSGVDFVRDGRGTDDCNGHGTSVASLIGGKTYGVAKNVTLVPVRVFGCVETISDAEHFIAAIDWVTANRTPHSVANMSISIPGYQPLDDAVTRSVQSGVVWTVSAGNDAKDACAKSPARNRTWAITVGATDRNDRAAGFSNFGNCLAIYAPGVDIPAAGIASSTASVNFGGTSASAPLVAGVVALYLQNRPRLGAANARAWLTATAQQGILTGLSGSSPNLLLSSRLPWGPSVALSRSRDSTLQMMGTTLPMNSLMWSKQHTMTGTTWTAPVTSGHPSNLSSSAAATTSGGWNIQFLIAPDGGISYHIEGLDAPFWKVMDGQRSSLSVALQRNGRLRVVATDKAGTVYTRLQAGTDRTAAWGPWERLGGTEREMVQVAAQDGGNISARIEIFGVNAAGEIYHRYQTTADGPFTDWERLPGVLVNVALARTSDGTLVAAGTNHYGQLFTATQGVGGIGTWHPWVHLDGYVTQVAIERRPTGGVQMFAVDGAHQVWQRHQISQTSPWSGWQLFGGSLRG